MQSEDGMFIKMVLVTCIRVMADPPEIGGAFVLDMYVAAVELEDEYDPLMWLYPLDRITTNLTTAP